MPGIDPPLHVPARRQQSSILGWQVVDDFVESIPERVALDADARQKFCLDKLSKHGADC